jgi:hypothetical protein
MHVLIHCLLHHVLTLPRIDIARCLLMHHICLQDWRMRSIHHSLGRYHWFRKEEVLLLHILLLLLQHRLLLQKSLLLLVLVLDHHLVLNLLNFLLVASLALNEIHLLLLRAARAFLSKLASSEALLARRPQW